MGNLSNSKNPAARRRVTQFAGDDQPTLACLSVHCKVAIHGLEHQALTSDPPRGIGTWHRQREWGVGIVAIIESSKRQPLVPSRRPRCEPLKRTGWKMHPTSPAEGIAADKQVASSTVGRIQSFPVDRRRVEPLFSRASRCKKTQVRARCSPGGVVLLPAGAGLPEAGSPEVRLHERCPARP